MIRLSASLRPHRLIALPTLFAFEAITHAVGTQTAGTNGAFLRLLGEHRLLWTIPLPLLLLITRRSLCLAIGFDHSHLIQILSRVLPLA